MTDNTIPAVPKTTRAAVSRTLGLSPEIVDDYPLKQPQDLLPGECIVKLECTGVCHSDIHWMMGDWAYKPRLPSVGGHEGIGRVLAIGSGTADPDIKIGDRVGIKFVLKTCLRCEMCRKGYEEQCLSGLSCGFRADGTFAEYMLAYTDHLIPIPEGLSGTSVAPVLCAGTTVYSAIKRSNTGTGDYIAISGAGGGLGHLAIQYAVAAGLRPIAIDTGASKRELCLSLGADTFVDFRDTNSDVITAVKERTGGLGAHAVLVLTGSDVSYAQAALYVRPRGTIVALGIPAVPTPSTSATDMLSVATCIVRGITLIGMMLGSRQDAREALDLVVRGKVHCVVEERQFAELPSVLQEIKDGKSVGRVVLKY